MHTSVEATSAWTHALIGVAGGSHSQGAELTSPPAPTVPPRPLFLFRALAQKESDVMAGERLFIDVDNRDKRLLLASPSTRRGGLMSRNHQ